MGTTKIEWTDMVWNPLRGCSKISEGCSNCYAEGMAARFSKPGEPFEGTITDRHWNGTVRLIEEKLTDPLRWKRPRRIFVNSVSDLFHANVPDEWIDRIFAVMALCPQHTFQVLTKRPERMREYMAEGRAVAIQNAIDESECWDDSPIPDDEMAPLVTVRHGGWPLPNVWLGASVENQAAADERRAPLATLAAQGWHTFASSEPRLGPVDWSGWEFLRWLITGGESGAKARPMHPDWARGDRDWAKAHGVPFMLKQRGEWVGAEHDQFGKLPSRPICHIDSAGKLLDPPPQDENAGCLTMKRVGKEVAGHMLDGREHMEFPEVHP